MVAGDDATNRRVIERAVRAPRRRSGNIPEVVVEIVRVEKKVVQSDGSFLNRQEVRLHVILTISCPFSEKESPAEPCRSGLLGGRSPRCTTLLDGQQASQLLQLRQPRG